MGKQYIHIIHSCKLLCESNELYFRVGLGLGGLFIIFLNSKLLPSLSEVSIITLGLLT